MTGRPGMMIYFDIRPGLNLLDPVKRCAVYDAILDYGQFGTVPEFNDPACDMFWELIRPRLDSDAETYQHKCKKRRDAANARWSQMQTDAKNANASFALEQNTSEHNSTTTQHRSTEIESKAAQPPPLPIFSPPGLDEIKEFCDQNRLSVSPERFFNHYKGNGWKVGQNPMQDWRSTILNWESREKEVKHGARSNAQAAAAQFGKIGTRL